MPDLAQDVHLLGEERGLDLLVHHLEDLRISRLQREPDGDTARRLHLPGGFQPLFVRQPFPSKQVAANRRHPVELQARGQNGIAHPLDLKKRREAQVVPEVGIVGAILLAVPLHLREDAFRRSKPIGIVPEHEMAERAAERAAARRADRQRNGPALLIVAGAVGDGMRRLLNVARHIKKLPVRHGKRIDVRGLALGSLDHLSVLVPESDAFDFVKSSTQPESLQRLAG